jgi:hypothetical protein
MIANLLVHLKHVNSGLFKHSVHLFVAANLALVIGVLQVIAFDVLPKLLDDLWARQLL